MMIPIDSRDDQYNARKNHAGIAAAPELAFGREYGIFERLIPDFNDEKTYSTPSNTIRVILGCRPGRGR